jgi:hypothetical protein
MSITSSYGRNNLKFKNSSRHSQQIAHIYKHVFSCSSKKKYRRVLLMAENLYFDVRQYAFDYSTLHCTHILSISFLLLPIVKHLELVICRAISHRQLFIINDFCVYYKHTARFSFQCILLRDRPSIHSHFLVDYSRAFIVAR